MRLHFKTHQIAKGRERPSYYRKLLKYMENFSLSVGMQIWCVHIIEQFRNINFEKILNLKILKHIDFISKYKSLRNFTLSKQQDVHKNVHISTVVNANE